MGPLHSAFADIGIELEHVDTPPAPDSIRCETLRRIPNRQNIHAAWGCAKSLCTTPNGGVSDADANNDCK